MIPPDIRGEFLKKDTFNLQFSDNLRFSGSGNKLSLTQKLMMTLMGAQALVLGGAVPPGDVGSARAAQTYSRRENFQWSQTDIQRYQALARQWGEAEAQPLNSEGRNTRVNQLKNDWEQLLSEARQGGTSAMNITHQMLRDQMYSEIVTPGPHLVRFNYYGYDEQLAKLRNSQITRTAFDTEIQWRGIEGIANHMGTVSADALGSISRRFYPVITQALDNNSDGNVQKWGHYALQNLFPNLSSEQQEAVARRFADAFLSEAAGVKKLSAMRGLSWLKASAPNLSLWSNVTEQTKARLDSIKDSPFRQEEATYYITLLGMMRDPNLTTTLEPLLTPKATPQVQQAIAWSLGRVQSAKGLELLGGMLSNNRFSPLGQEMAVYSLETYRGRYSTQVMALLNTYSQDSPTVDDTVEEAARAMLEKTEDRSDTEDEFYMNRLLKTPEEREQYRQIRTQYVKGWENLSLSQRNFLDRALIPYRRFLPEIIRRQGEHKIISGTVTQTPEYKSLIGHRATDGRLYDDIEGVSSTNGAVTSAGVMTPGRFNTFSHEFWHHLHQMILNNRSGETQRIVDLFNQGKALDYYAAFNEYEFLAQGGEAYNARYKDHAILYVVFFQNGFQSTDSHTRSQLMRNDPALYRYIESLTCVTCNLAKQAGEDVKDADLKKASGQ